MGRSCGGREKIGGERIIIIFVEYLVYINRSLYGLVYRVFIVIL